MVEDGGYYYYWTIDWLHSMWIYDEMMRLLMKMTHNREYAISYRNYAYNRIYY